jgi:hypothetical protein
MIMPPSAFEYRRATWTEVCDLGPKGWRLVPVPPVQEMKQLLNQVQPGELLYTMEREAVHRMTAQGQVLQGRKVWLPQEEDGQPSSIDLPGTQA